MSADPAQIPGRSPAGGPSRFAIHSLRSARTAAYWLASPLDAAVRAARGASRLPPLWLRRHTGPVDDFEASARATAELLDRLRLFQPTSRVLDLGCGCGAMTPYFARRLADAGRYAGLDVHGPSIRWCADAFGGDPRLAFVLATIRSPYGGGTAAPADYRFPLADAAVDFVLAKSLFTHLPAEEARSYLAEVRRVLRPGGKGLISAFLFDGERHASPPAFPYPLESSAVRCKRRLHPHAAVAFDRATFERWLADSGLTPELIIPGFFPGGELEVAGQDVLVVG
jgi:SAM-dependent methyltransferase